MTDGLNPDEEPTTAQAAVRDALDRLYDSSDDPEGVTEVALVEEAGRSSTYSRSDLQDALASLIRRGEVYVVDGLVRPTSQTTS